MMAANNDSLSPLRIVVGSDNAGYEYKTALKAELETNPRVSEVLDVGVVNAHDSTAYPHLAVDASKKIIAGEVRSFRSTQRMDEHADMSCAVRLTEHSSSVALALESPSQPTRFPASEQLPQAIPTVLNGQSAATMLKCSASDSESLDWSWRRS